MHVAWVGTPILHGGAAASGTVQNTQVINNMVITFKMYYLLEMQRRTRKKHSKTVCNKCFKNKWAAWSTHGFGGYAIADATGQDGIADGSGE